MNKTIFGFIIGFILAVFSFFRFLSFIFNRLVNASDGKLVNKTRELLVCWFSTLLFADPDSLYIKKNYYTVHPTYKTYYGRKRYDDTEKVEV